MSEVYRHGSQCVNPRERVARLRRLLAVPLAATFAAGVATTGCAVRSTSQRPASSRAHLIMAAYDVEPVFVSQGRRAGIDTIRRDFHQISELGLGGILLRHVDEGDRTTVLDVAGESGLCVALTSQSLQHFVRTGVLPAGCRSITALVRAAGIQSVSSLGRATIALECGIGTSQVDRCSALHASIEEAGLRSVVIAPQDARPGARSLTAIDTAAGTLDRQDSPLEAWLAQYHRGLSAGRTSGLVFQRYRRIPGDGPGLQSANESPGPARTSAVKELIARARLWAPRLIGATAAPMTGSTVRNDDLSLTTFVRGQRRYVMLFNRSLEHYHRGQVVLPDSIGSMAVERAVEVPTSKAKPAGRVFRARQGRIELSVGLRPGDAALFELF